MGLPPRYHQYKFIVDGKWRHDETAPFMPDPLGNVNNWLFVRRIDSNPNPGGGFDSQFQQLAQQQQMQQQMQQMSAQQQQQQIPHSQPNLMFAGLSTTTLPSASMMGPVASPLPPPSQLIAAPLSPHLQHSISTQPLTGPLPSSSSSTARIAPQDVDMTHSDSMANLRDPLGGVAGPHPIVIHNPKEPEYTRKKVGDFLTGHNCYELIPESGKVVVIDVDLPVRADAHLPSPSPLPHNFTPS